MAERNALIVTNTIGMFHFLWSDIDMLNQMGYRVFAMADNSAREEHTLRIMQEKGVTFVDARGQQFNAVEKQSEVLQAAETVAGVEAFWPCALPHHRSRAFRPVGGAEI